MPELTACTLWKDPSATLSRPMEDVFSLEWESPEESHFWRYALKCHDCGQTYFFQFLEEIDWEDGYDDQLSIYVPYAGQTALDALKREDRLSVLLKRPQLRMESPMGTSETTLEWLTARPAP
jgi:hypothetical protein